MLGRSTSERAFSEGAVILSVTPQVAVIIPTYNRADAVCRAIESVLVQTYPRVEIIVVDDGSTDDTRSRLRQFGGKIRVIWKQNSGPAAARNTGVRESTGEVIAFLDSDDLYLPTKLERQVALLNQAGPSVCCCLCNTLLHFWDGRRTSSFELSPLEPQQEFGVWLNATEVLSTRFVIFNQAAAIRREAFEWAGGFDESLRLLEDYDLALRLSVKGPWVFLNEPLVVWRQSMDSLSREALIQTLRVKQYQVKIWQRLLSETTVQLSHESLRRLLKREIERSQRAIRAETLVHSASIGTRLLGNTLRGVERVRTIIFRRSSWYPRMKTLTLEEWASDSISDRNSR